MSRVQEIADELVASGAERGLQVAAYVGGEQVVDVVAGQAAPGRPVTPDTLFYNWSIGKGATATLVHHFIAGSCWIWAAISDTGGQGGRPDRYQNL